MNNEPTQPENRREPVRITDLVLRDAHQSLLATRMKTEDMLPICEALDKVGYWSLEVWGGATFDSCLRFLGEDPWERLRKIKAALPKTKLQMLFRGQNILGYRHYADDVVRRFVDKSVEYGMDVFRVFDALNDPRNLETAVSQVIKDGAHAQGAICYTISPVHTIERFVELGRQLESMGCHSICIKDMAALMTPVPAAELVRALKAAVKIPVHVHTHSTTGVAPMVLIKVIEAGADGVDTAISSMSGGSGHVATEALVETFRGTPYDTGLDQNKLIPVADYFRKVRVKYKDFETSFSGSDPRIFISQIPGGMISNLESQLKQMGCLERIDDVLAEVPKVRAEMGYIPLVTPTSQIVGTQAAMNVILGERYKSVPQESKDVFKGMYGKTPAPVDAEIQKKVLAGEEPITCRPADLIPNEWDKIKAEVEGKARNDDDVLSYALFPKVWLKFYEDKLNPNRKPAEKAVAKPAAAQLQPAAPVPAPAPADGGYRMTLNINGQKFDASVTVLEP
ncbi:pyruvate carboxylase subunit B [bacterium]|nr:pyruvate carboxylase subunit B [bacterium]